MQYVPVTLDVELFVQTTNDPDCVGCAIHGRYQGLVREVEFEDKVEVGVEFGAVVNVKLDFDVDVELEVVVVDTSDGRGSTTAQMEEIVLRAGLARSAAHEESKHELAKGLKVWHWHAPIFKGRSVPC